MRLTYFFWSHVSLLLSPSSPYSFPFLLLIFYVCFFGTHTASCFLGRGLRSIENCLLLLCNGPLIKEVMLCVQNSAAAVPHTSLSPTGPIACTGSALTAAVRRPPGRAASRTAHRFKSTVDDDRVHRRHSAWDLAR